MMKHKIEIHNNNIILFREDGSRIELGSKEAFSILKKLWLKAGWDTKYVYSFTWLGRPIIQLPDDMIRIQEVIYQIKPTLIIETGIAHGGSLIFYASLLKMLGKGRVVGVDIEIREHNKKAIKDHVMSSMITLIEGSSIDNTTVRRVEQEINQDDIVLVILDSNHSKDHVLHELRLYSKFVSNSSYIVATDGIMQEVVGGPRTKDDWIWNNPQQAVKEFLEENDCFILENIKPIFNESIVDSSPTYWPNAWLKKIKM